MKKLLAAVLLLCASVCAYGQGATILFPPVTDPQGHGVPFVTINFCTTPTTVTNGVCNTPVTVFQNQTLSTPYSSAIQTDGLGNFPPNVNTTTAIWFPAAANYCYSLSGSITATNICYPFSIPVANGGAATFAGLTVTAPGITASSATISGALNAKITDTVKNVDAFATSGTGTSGSPWTSTSGTGGCQEAITALGANGGKINFREGFYTFTTTTGCQLADNVTVDSMGRSAILQAGANNVLFFTQNVASTHANFSRIFNLTLEGNGFTGVTGMDMSNMRFGSTIQNVNFNNMATGFIGRLFVWSTSLVNASFRAVSAPIHIFGSSSTFLMSYVQIDNENFVPTVACTNGIVVDNTGGQTIGVQIVGGYVQGCTNGLVDSAIGLHVDDTYFEDNTTDISCSAGVDSHYMHTQHWAAVGAVAIKGRNCTGIVIDHPEMGSGARSTGLFDWDGTNTNTTADYIVDAGAKNTPAGTTTGITGITFHIGTWQASIGSKSAPTWSYIGNPNYGTFFRAGGIEDSIAGVATRNLTSNGEFLANNGTYGISSGQTDAVLPDVTFCRLGVNQAAAGTTAGTCNSGSTFKAKEFLTDTNCSAVGTAASPSVAACGSAASGQFSCATNATGATCTVSTTAVTASSEIIIQESDTTVTGTRLGVTCNTGTNVLPASRLLASSIAATSFTINLGTVTTNPACFSYWIVN